MTESYEFLQGFEAFNLGEPFEANPYKVGKLHDDWQEGFNLAKDFQN